ncbi:MAG: LysR family transcriptional regulator, partial [Pseudomonadota bacterium]|nr:LysR family transcriptional regulator [Pseudomonadota bacterium]
MRHMSPFKYVDIVARTGSIRRAAETLAITSTALNRRILTLEEELGVSIFERHPRGVRLSAAGELLIHHIRTQMSDLERVKSQIADLSGERRGHVSIACSQALLPYFLPEQISIYRKAHPKVTFEVLLRDRAEAEQALLDISADIALVFEPVRLLEFQHILTIRQPVHAIMAPDHPLAGQDVLRLRDIVQHPVAVPSHAYGVRHLLEIATIKSSLVLNPMVESDSFEFLRHHAVAENIISFQLPIGLPQDDPGIVSRPIDSRD